MSDLPPDRKVRLISQGYNTWKMQVLFTKPEMPASEISERLREVKRELAQQFGIPDSLLEYTGLLGRQNTRNGLLVQLQITKQDVPSNAPRFRTAPVSGPDGTAFTDMVLLADFHPYDEYDRPLSRHVIEAKLVAAGFPLAWIDWPVVESTVEQMLISMEPVTNVIISRGVLPGVGNSSRLTYGVRRDQERFMQSAWIGVRPVVRNEFLVEVSTPTGSHQWGRNVYGRELEPRSGQQVRLEAGDGTQMALRGKQLIAACDGMLVLERCVRDRREKDAYDLLPVKLIGRVLPIKELEGSSLRDEVLGEATVVYGSLTPGARIRTTSSLFIDGDIERDCRIECAGSLRVSGYMRKATIICAHHVCVHGEIADSHVDAALTLLVDERLSDSTVRATDILARDIRGGDVEAMRQVSLDKLADSSGGAGAIRINLHRFLENRQMSGREALEELRKSLSEIVDIFGPEITLQACEGKEQRLLLKWLRQQKALGIGNYTHAEVQDFREVLELIPLIREQLTAIGIELRDVTGQLQDLKSE